MENTTTEQKEFAAPQPQKPGKPLNVWMISTIVLLVVVIVLGCGLALPDVTAKILGGKKSSSSTGAAQSAADKAVAYIKSNYDPSITLNKVEEGETCFYKIGLNYNGKVVNSYVSTDAKYLFPADPVDISKEKVAGNFEATNEANVCQENGKPIIYFFGSSTCPHCQWEKPIIQAVTTSFGDTIVYKEDISSDGSVFKNADVFNKYSPTGGVPVLVLGCKYARVGSGETDGEATEKANLTKLICGLTNNQPSSICANAK